MSADVWGLIVFYKTDISRLISVSLTVADRLTRLTSPGNGFCHRSVPSFMY